MISYSSNIYICDFSRFHYQIYCYFFFKQQSKGHDCCKYWEMKKDLGFNKLSLPMLTMYVIIMLQTPRDHKEYAEIYTYINLLLGICQSSGYHLVANGYFLDFHLKNTFICYQNLNCVYEQQFILSFSDCSVFSKLV